MTEQKRNIDLIPIKKLLITIGKSLLFFIGWALLASFLPIPDSSDGAVWRFWAELIPLLAIVIMTALFWFIEKKKVPLNIVSSPLKGSAVGIIAGIVWLGAAVVILILTGTMTIVGHNSVPMLWLWIISVFLNTIMQEMLVRGYLYQLIKANYNTVAAAVVTTALFTLMHGGAFEAGIIPVLNIVTMSLLMTAVLEYTHSLTAPIIMHFIWNCVGAVILGGVSLADDYPNLCVTEFTGNALLSGGEFKIEGSVVVSLLNTALTLVFLFLMKKTSNNPTEKR